MLTLTKEKQGLKRLHGLKVVLCDLKIDNRQNADKLVVIKTTIGRTNRLRLLTWRIQSMFK